MNTAQQFMDKQIMDLSASGSHSGSSGGGGGGGNGVEFIDLMNTQEDRHQTEGKKEEILPSYDFQPIRSFASSSSPSSAESLQLRPSWNSADSKIGSSSIKYGGVLEPHEVAKVSPEKAKAKAPYDQATVAEIDRTMKKHADNLLHALEGISSRLSQLESRTRHLEKSVDELKVSVGNNSGSTDGKLRHLENILREVQVSMQVLRDKQEIAETHLQLAKVQTSKGDHLQSETSNTGQFDSKQQVLPSEPQAQPSQQVLQPPLAPVQPSLLPALPAPNAPPPPPPPSQNPSSTQFPTQLPHPQISSVPSLPRDPYFPPPSQPNDPTHHQYQMPPQQAQLPLPPPTKHYQSTPQHPQYSQPPPQPPQSVNPSLPLQPTLPHPTDESAPYMPPPPQTYPPIVRPPPPLNQPTSGPPPPQQFYGPNPNIYEPPSSRPSTGQHSFSGGYGSQMGPNYSDSYPYSGSPSHYSSTMKQSPFSSSGSSAGGSGSYPRVPTAQILPQAQLTGPSPGGPTGNRLPIDDVVDKFATMGFSREQVRATVQKLTENGQSVDLNVVLDKLMNEGDMQPQKGWFGR